MAASMTLSCGAVAPFPFHCLQLLAGSRLPSLYDSKHFVNLTNGLELAPLLQRLHLPFRQAGKMRQQPRSLQLLK